MLAHGETYSARSWVRDSLHEKTFHMGFLLALCAFLAAQPFIRDRGGFLFWAFAAIAILYVVVAARPRVVPPLLVLTAVGVVIIGLSYANVLPDAWTTTYVASIIPRQAFYVVLLYPLVTAAAAMWSYARSTGRTAQFFVVILVATGLAAPLVELAYGGGGALRSYASMATGGFGNARMLFYMAFTYVLLVRIRNLELARAWTLLVVAAMFAAFAFVVTDAQYQNMIGLVVLLLVSFVRPTRTMVIVLTVVAVVGYAALLPYGSTVYRLDANSGYRLLAARDALRGATDTYGIGVGFGKEVVSGHYADAGVFRDDLTRGGTLLGEQGVHNSFAQEAMRLGIVGGVCVAWLFLVTCFPPMRGPLRERRHLVVVYFLLLISLALNTALESPTYLVGIAFGVGYILAAKDSYVAAGSRTVAGRDGRQGRA